MSNKLTRIARELLCIEADLPCRLNYSDLSSRPTVDDFDMYTFEQSWGSTCLGFGGIGGQAITSAQTYVFVPQIDSQKCFVYFAGRFAYSVEYSRIFMEDVVSGRVASVSEHSKYVINDGNR